MCWINVQLVGYPHKVVCSSHFVIGISSIVIIVREQIAKEYLEAQSHKYTLTHDQRIEKWAILASAHKF